MDDIRWQLWNEVENAHCSAWQVIAAQSQADRLDVRARVWVMFVKASAAEQPSSRACRTHG